MPLVAAALNDALEEVFSAPGATAADCATQWADALGSYVSGIVPASTTVAAAQAALATALTAAFAGTDPVTTTVAMDAAFAAFAATVGGGMATFTPTPPAGPVGFGDLLVPPFAETSPDAAAAVATKVHAWLTTGVATLIAPPFTVLTWS